MLPQQNLRPQFFTYLHPRHPRQRSKWRPRHRSTQAQIRYLTNLVPRARDPLGRGTKGSGIIHLIIASDWLGRNVAI